jgi:hypothetical protein
MGLFHPRVIIPRILERYNEKPNIMDVQKLPDFKKGYSLGYCLTLPQQKLIHSFIAGNNNYEAFVDSQRDLDIYLNNLAEANNFIDKTKL